MSAEYSVEEVRACLAEFSADVAFPREEIDIEKVRAMLIAYAERIKADESAVPVAVTCEKSVGDNSVVFSTLDWLSLATLPSGTKLFTHPPAQAAQVDGAAALAHFTDYFVRNYPGPNTIIYDPKWHAPKIFRAAQYAIANATTNATTTPPTAEPVAQDEAIDPLQDCRAFVESWRLESTGSNGHDVIANRNTVRRLVHIIDHLAAQPRAVPDGMGEAADSHGWHERRLKAWKDGKSRAVPDDRNRPIAIPAYVAWELVGYAPETWMADRLIEALEKAGLAAAPSPGESE